MGKVARQWQEHIVDIARLLGYSIQSDRRYTTRQWQLYNPDGRLVVTNAQGQVLALERPSDAWFAKTTYKNQCQAAAAALKLEGIDARSLKPLGKNGARDSRIPEIFERRNQLERISDRAHKPARRRR